MDAELLLRLVREGKRRVPVERGVVPAHAAARVERRNRRQPQRRGHRDLTDVQVSIEARIVAVGDAELALEEGRYLTAEGEAAEERRVRIVGVDRLRETDRRDDLPR